MQVKIVDFGFAGVNLPHTEGQSSQLTTPVFTLQYAAPEVLYTVANNNNSSIGYDKSCDVWSLGVILVSFVCVNNC